MPGKLTIRRVGHILPTLCLVVLLILLAALTWLSTAGLPGSVLRQIEHEVLQATGVPVSISKIKFAPRSGLAIKAEGTRVEITQPDAAPAIAEIPKILVTFRLPDLLEGELIPAKLHILRGSVDIPLSTKSEDVIQVDNFNLYVRRSAKRKSIGANLTTTIQGIALQGKFNLAGISEIANEEISTDEPAASAQTGPGELLAGIRPWLKDFKEQTNKQDWSEVKPHLDVKVSFNNEWNISLLAQIPSYHLGDFHFTNTQLDAVFEKNALNINKLNFQIEKPDTRVHLQASYDITSRELSFTTTSTAPVVKIITDYLKEDAPETLSRIRATNGSTPQIQLNGTAAFSEDFALNSITLLGKLEQRGLVFGKQEADHLQLSFFMKDGDFNLDQCMINFPEGHLRCAAQVANGTGKAELEISLSDEVILELVRCFSGDEKLALPQELSFSSNLEAHLSCEMSTAPFIAGKSRIEDLIPALKSSQLQFRTGDIIFDGAKLLSPTLNLEVSGISYQDDIKVQYAHLQLRAANALENQLETRDVHLDLEFNDILSDSGLETLKLGHTELNVNAGAVEFDNISLNRLQCTSSADKLELSFDHPIETLESSALAIHATLESLHQRDISAEDIALDVDIPTGLDISDAWLNMQQDTHVQATLKKLTGANGFSATETSLSLKNTEQNAVHLQLDSKLGKETLTLSADASLAPENELRISNVTLNLPAAELKPLLGGEPLQELKLPRNLSLSGDACIDTESGTVRDCHFNLKLPELVRVCNEVYAHKGLEIPLQVEASGHFSTAQNGDMRYEADVKATHKEGVLDAHVTGNPLSECRITGNNTIPISIINALIDNADAHWIMRDFRCTPGLTRNVITDIDTTIRYDRGIYVHALCKANLYNLDFQLGAVMDKTDSQGNPTGEEYLRTDLGRDPFTRVKEGHCDVDVLVKLDCTDAAGNPEPDAINIDLLNPDLLYDNRPWLRYAKIKNGVASSRISGEAVRFDIEKRIISLHKLKGECYPGYAIGMYYAPLHDFLSDIVLERPADIETDYCVFPISSRCEIPMQGLIRVEADRGAGYKFLGTTIPFRNFSGFINISDTDVYLDRLNAQSWGGVVNGALRIGFSGQHTTLDGYFSAQNLNLKDIVASYGVDFTPATCNGFIRVQAPRPDLDAVQAYGQVHLQNGDLMEIGLFRPIRALISDMPKQLEKLQNSLPGAEKIQLPSWSTDFTNFVWDTSGKTIDSVGRTALQLPFANHFLRYGISHVFTRFDITKGHLITRDMKAGGYNLDVGVDLDIDLNTLTMKGNLWPHISSVPTVLISPVTILSDFLIDINLHGDLLDPQWDIGLSKKLKGDQSSLSSQPQQPEAETKQ